MRVKDEKSAGRKRGAGSFGLLYFLAALVIVFSLISDTFLTAGNISNVFLVQITVGCVALGALLILIIGEFDLSLGYVVGFCMMLGAYLAGKEVHPALVIAAMAAAGAAAGFLNGIFTVRFGISSFVSTLAVGIALSGLTLGLSGGQILYNNIPVVLTEIGQSKFLGIGWCVWIFLGLCILMFFVLQYTTFGRSLYAVGGSVRISFLAGIRTDRIRILAFTLAGLFAGIASMIQLGQSGAALPAFGPSLLMPAYAAVFLGVTAYRPGTYNLPGFVLAFAVIGVGVNGLSLVGAPFWAESMFNGSILIISVLTAKKEARSVKVG